MEKKVKLPGGAGQADGQSQGQEESILGCTMQSFPKHLLQTPVSLKIILLLPAHHKRFQVCPVLLYSESVWMKNR